LSARVPLVIAASAVVACAQIVGIGDFAGAPDAGADAPSSDAPSTDAPQNESCTNAIITSSSNVDSISVGGAFVFTQWFENAFNRCPIGAKCSDPDPAFSVGADDVFEYAAVGASIVYSTTNDTGGTIHRIDVAGTNDKTLVTTAASPSFVAIGDATHTYWVDDDQPATVHCVECAGSDSVWIQNVDSPAALFADGASVYVLASDASGVTSGIFGCAANQACANNPRDVIQGLPSNSLGPTNVTSDGARVFVPRIPFADIASVDALGNTKSLVNGVNATALAVDGTSGELFYGTSDGRVGRVKSDGSTASTTLSNCQSEILAIALDATSVYVLITDFVLWTVVSIPR
jgi:hypothetical protein